MAASREFQFVIDPDAQHRLERQLKITRPVTVKFTTVVQNKTNGTYNAGLNMITIHLGRDLFQNSRLPAVKRTILTTLLHEFRHAHQYATWDAAAIAKDLARPYWKQDMERDAREWASRNAGEWGCLGRLSPKATRSRLSRLSAAERSVR